MMKVKRTALIFMAACLVGMMIFAAKAYPEGNAVGEWDLVGFTKYRDALFMDRDSIKGLGDNRFTVRLKIAPSRKSKSFSLITRELKRAKKSAKTFKYAEIFCDVDCSAGQVRYRSVVYHRKNGRVIHTATNPAVRWRPVDSGSLWDALRKAVCGQK